MLPYIHFIISSVLIIALFPIYGYYSAIILISGFFIDIDHLIFFYLKTRDLNPKRAYKYLRSISLRRDLKKYQEIINIFHTYEFLILIIILSMFNKIFFIFMIGLLAHVIPDYIYLYKRFKSIKSQSLIWHAKKLF